ncbi:helix-turn-helix domain-containing protein [Micromonospora gifhornensis]|uniref:helix-turn-helix domain-containing protein n=1 Tax=Micromonospora gifhornensis TaxID=84594 RepID=UPI003D757A95
MSPIRMCVLLRVAVRPALDVNVSFYGSRRRAYLTEWRMTLAADMLADTTATVAAVARRIGYADAFGFSAASKRVNGVSPSQHRKRARAR